MNSTQKKEKIKQIMTSTHPESQNLEKKENLLRQLYLILTIGWDAFSFILACITSSFVAKIAGNNSFYSDKVYDLNIFGVRITADPSEEFFTSPFMVFLGIIIIAALIGLAIWLFFTIAINSLTTRRLTIDNTYRTMLLTEYMASNNITDSEAPLNINTDENNTL